MPEEVPLTHRDINFNPNPCTKSAEASNWGKVGDTINNITNEINEIIEEITNIITASCEELLACEIEDLPPDFPPTEPPTIPNVIDTIWTELKECCGEDPGDFCQSVEACLADFCQRVENCITNSCDQVRNCIYNHPFDLGCSEDTSMCWGCVEVVEDVQGPQANQTVVYNVDLAPTVVVDVDFNEETCQLTVDYYNQSDNDTQITYVTEVTQDKILIAAGLECSPVPP